jgi:hypothetical protein
MEMHNVQLEPNLTSPIVKPFAFHNMQDAFSLWPQGRSESEEQGLGGFPLCGVARWAEPVLLISTYVLAAIFCVFIAIKG